MANQLAISAPDVLVLAQSVGTRTSISDHNAGRLDSFTQYCVFGEGILRYFSMENMRDRLNIHAL